MAKDNKVNVNLNADDKGSLKKLGAKARSAGKDMGSFARNVHDSDRRLKGASQQSSNSTKNFSKMAQTMEGGIVPIYATLAAQVFAVTAAFQFFQNSVDFNNLIKGQQAFGAITGTAFRTYTKDIQAATAGQINFRDAAQATAIGVAAGLSRDQLTEIGRAAKNVSLALGRDLTDSFNRLTRGITKAEPELLDELGIVLRLEPALKAYADSIGKTVQNLNQFEKSQAVAQEVLGQAEKKFAAIEKAMDPSAFALRQFSVAFGEVVQALQQGVATILTPILGFLSENVLALAGALALFTKPILESVLPNFEAMGASAEKNFARTERAFLKAQGARNLAKFEGDQVGGRQAAYRGISQMNRQIGRKAPANMRGQMSKKMIDAEFAQLKRGGVLREKLNKKERRQYYNHLKLMEQSLVTSKQKQKGIEVSHSSFLDRENKRRLMLHAKYEQMKVQVTRVAARGMQLAMSAVGVLGVIGLIVGGIQMLAGAFNRQSDAQKEFNDNIEDSIKSAKGLNEELARMVSFREKGYIAVGSETTGQFANMIKSAGGIRTREQKFNDLKTGAIANRGDGAADTFFKDNAGEISRTAGYIKNLTAENKRLTEQMKDASNPEFFQRQIDGNNALIASHEKKIDTMETVSYKDDELNKLNRENIATYRNLAENAVGPLAEYYLEYAEALKQGKKPSDDLVKRIYDEEVRITSMADRVAKASEVTKTFNQSLSGMGKSGLFQQQRSALDDMIKTQQAIVDSQKEGGGEAIQIDVDRLAQLKTFQTDINALVKESQEDEKTKEQNARKRLDYQLATNNELKLEGIATKNLASQEKQREADRNHRMALIARDALDLKTATKEQIADADHAVEIAKEKLETSNKEVEVQEKLTELEAAKLRIAIAKTASDVTSAQIQGQILDKQIAAVGMQSIFGATGAGKRAQAEAKIEQDKLKFQQKAEEIRLRNETRADRQMGMSQKEIELDNIKTSNLEKQNQLLEEQTKFAEYATTFIGELHISFAKGIEDMFVAIATGAKSAKEAFKDMAIFMLKKMAEMAAQQLAFKAMTAMGFGIPMANGGIIPMASGGVIRKYATGGIATEPTYLVGEGKYNEAVVPLPDGRTIPVDMKGGSGSTNNVTITVNADGSSTNSFDGERGKALGMMIEAATMEVIQREKRPGGVLGR